ncbi:hypothetical protein GPECTOR_47g373 [Gonium pectorale]|uniref:DOMON domain-containing protein n=1 Tax=Gonium pectorale TaxID=33097 RepID=A0A150G8B0_GONPE|nr:hypothetical protein GPECTOR_47g373 [Gonium pectorale]|eukprot:KXZ46096.1 hypothetical protein GPECTOR_47g373 [Gonium pectorale]
MRPRPGVSSPGAARSGGAAKPTFALPAAAALLLVAGAAFASGASAASCYRSLSRSDFPHCALLSPTYALHWAVRGDNITLGLDADTGGHPDSWLGLALSDAGGMKGADILVVAGPSDQEGFDDPDGYYASDSGSESDEEAASASSSPPRYIEGPGGWRVIDAHALQFGQPIADMRQDVTLLSAPLSGANHTVAVVTRRLRTCDPWDRNIQIGIPQTVSWAYGRGWPSKHLARGDSSVFFVPEADRLWGAANATARTTTAAAAAAKPAPTGAAATEQPPLARPQQLQERTKLYSSSGQKLLPEAVAGTDGRRATGSNRDGIGGAYDGTVVEDGTSGSSRATSAAASWMPAETPEAAARELAVVMPNITVPDNVTTTYKCMYVTLPHDRKYHLVSYRAAVLTPLIHHMVLWACEKRPEAYSPGRVYDCLELSGGEGCHSFFIGWVPGLTGIDYPPAAGVPIGEPYSTFFSLQVHYNNPEHVSGVVDASGFEIIYTPRLRPYDAGILTVGQKAIAIPPGRPKYSLAPSLKTPLRLLGSGLHMHLLGKSIVTRHIRNGTELPPVGSKRFYDAAYQSLDPVPLDSSILAPGDVLITTCTYDSTTRDNATRYGEATQDEMCYNFMLVYPWSPDFVFCMSMDMAGDPRVALCAGGNATTAIVDTLQQMSSQQHIATAKGEGRKQAAAAAARKTGSSALPAAPQQAELSAPPPADLSAVPALAPFFASGALVRVPAADMAYETYGRNCPDMSYVPSST